MWECTNCRLVMRTSVLHRHMRAGCAARRAAQPSQDEPWSTGLAAVGVALVAGLVSYTCMRYW